MNMRILQRVVFWVSLALPAILQAQPFKHKLDDFSYNVWDVVSEADAWYEVNGTGPGTGYKGYQRWKYEMERRFYPSGDRSQFDPGIAAREYASFKSTQRSTGGATGAWRYLGPDHANNILPPSWAAGVGRIEAVWGGSVTGDTIYLGSRSGGFWKTTNGGTTWRSTTQDQPALGVVDIVVHPDRQNEVWILTRHAAGYSYGILKSTNYGETWNATGLSYAPGAAYASQMFLPTLDTMYVATNAGIQRSVDGGVNFNLVYTGNVYTLAVHPSNSQIIYAMDANSNSTLRRSTDGGQNWSNLTITGNSGYSFLAVTPAAPNSIYVGSSVGVLRSTNLGNSWTLLSSNPTNSGFMALGVSGTDPNKIFAGSLNQYVSTNAGQTWTVFADWVSYFGTNYVHADGRVFRTYGNRIFLGTDGFLGMSTDNGNTWTRVNEYGTGVREFYRIGCTPLQVDRAVGGSQDNGTSAMMDYTWYEWIGADGMQAHFDNNNPNVWFGTIQLGGLQRSTLSGQNAADVAPAGGGAWITPSVIDPSNDNTIFIAYDSVYKSNDNGTTWRSIAGFNGNMDEIAIAPSDSNVLYISKGTRLRRSTNNGVTWTFADAGMPNQYITRIAIHPFNPMHVCVSLSGFYNTSKVFESTNGGVSWTNISGNLPNLPANCVVWSEAPERLFLGMDVGVYYRDPGSNLWTLYADSLPAVVINDLEVLEGAGLLRAATWGRGLWEAPMPGRENMPRITSIGLTPLPDLNAPRPSDSVWVKAVIEPSAQIQSAVLRWGTDGSTYPNTIPMALSTNDTFQVQQHIPAQPEDTRVYFRITAFVAGNDSIRSDRIMYQVKKAILCLASGSQGTTFDFIDTVRVGSLNHASGQEYYGDFRSIYTDLFRDSTYQLTLSLNYSFPLDSMFAWVDWNGNGALEMPSEQIIMSAIDPDHKSYGTLTVPHIPIVPDTVVMRVRSVYANFPVADPCGNYFGEVEDYSIVVRDPQVVVGTENPASDDMLLYPIPTHSLLQIRFPKHWDQGTFNVVDAQGRTWMQEIPFQGPTANLNVAGLVSGLYWIQANGNGEVRRVRFLVVR